MPKCQPILAEWACSVAVAWLVAALPTRGLNPILVLANGPNAGKSHPAATAVVEIPKLFEIKARLSPLQMQMPTRV